MGIKFIYNHEKNNQKNNNSVRDSQTLLKNSFNNNSIL
jgi:hypothetical protein